MSSRTVSGVASSFEAGAVDPTALLHPAGGPPSTAVTANGAAGAAAGASGAPGAHSGASVGTAGTAGAAAGGAAGTAVVAEARPPAWQSKEDRTDRMQMIQQIVCLLRKRKPDAPPEWINKLPEMARRLEDRLYRVATSKDEYKNMETLKQRLQDVAIKMGAKAKVSQQQGRSGAAAPRTALLKAIREAAQAGQIRQHPKEGPVVVVSINGETQMVPISRLRREQQDEVYEMYKAHRDRQKKNSSGGAGSGNSGRAVDPRDVNPQLAASGGRYTGGGGAGSGGYDAQSQAKRVKMAQPGGGASHGRAPSSSNAPPRNTDEHRKAIMRQQQQRLLLLRHASKCQEKRGKCKATALCAQMKELWQHIAQCKDQHCLHPHCVSSRYVLSHYHRCKQRNCEVCAPVRLAIQKQNNQQRPTKGKGSKGGKSSKGKKAKEVGSAGTIKIPDQAKPAVVKKAKMPAQQVSDIQFCSVSFLFSISLSHSISFSFSFSYSFHFVFSCFSEPDRHVDAQHDPRAPGEPEPLVQPVLHEEGADRVDAPAAQEVD